MKRPVPAWDPEFDDVFVCVAARAVTPDIATVLLAPRQDATVAFDAGQYVTIEFPVGGQSVQRCYTISSPPTRPERLAITVKRAASGVVSPWLHSGGLAVGSAVRVGPPQGEFTLERHPAGAYALLTAGAGITPALSVLREAHDLGTDLDVALVHSQRRVAQVPYGAELASIAAALPRARVHYVCGEHDAGDPAATPGRLDGRVLHDLVPDLADREVMVCGPDGYRADATAAALACGARPGRVHEESFTFAAPDPPAVTVADGAAAHRIEFRDHGVEVECPPGSTVLDAALAAGVPLSFSCAQGLCGTCKSTLLAGEVDMQHAGGIRPREIAAGKVLLCCSTPRTDLVITRQQ